MTERMALELVNKNSNNLENIADPSEAVQLAAVKRGGRSIKYIPNPSRQVQLAAVNQNGRAIAFIKDPSEEVQLAAVDANILAIEKILHPTQNVQDDVLSADSRHYSSIKRPSEATTLRAVRIRAENVKYIPKPTLKLLTKVYLENPEVIRYLDDHLLIGALSVVDDLDNPSSEEMISIKTMVGIEKMFEYLEETTYKENLQYLKRLYDL